MAEMVPGQKGRRLSLRLGQRQRHLAHGRFVLLPFKHEWTKSIVIALAAMRLIEGAPFIAVL
jgi:hypothetical protein